MRCCAEPSPCKRASTLHVHFVPVVGLSDVGRTLIAPWGLLSVIGGIRLSNHLGYHWPSTGGLLAINALGTQLRYLINSDHPDGS